MRQQPQTQQQTPPPPVSLNQKCAQCQQILGQGSAMYIEKLDLAFHLKCFRCSVCSVPLSNGKEGTDVRVSGLNRLHCNSCFSNDLGKCVIKYSSNATLSSSIDRHHIVKSSGTKLDGGKERSQTYHILYSTKHVESSPPKQNIINSHHHQQQQHSSSSSHNKLKLFKDDYNLLPNYLTHSANTSNMYRGRNEPTMSRRSCSSAARGQNKQQQNQQLPAANRRHRSQIYIDPKI